VRLLQAIDIGSNTVRSIVVEVPVGAAHRVVDDEREMTRLGRGLAHTGELESEAIEHTADALKAMLEIGRNLGVTEVRAIATEAVRRARNGKDFVHRIHEELDLEIEVVEPEEEGRLVWLSAASLTASLGASVVVDIGGGSVEIVQTWGSEATSIVSAPIGARVLTDAWLADDPPSGESFRALKRAIRQELRARIDSPESDVPVIVASGGSVNSIAALAAGARGERLESTHGACIERAEIMRLLGILSRSTLEQRLAMPGMSADRADTVLAGALVLADLLKLFGADTVLVNGKGIREGIVIDTLLGDGALLLGADRLGAVHEVGARYRFDRDHAEHVAALALSIFDQLAERLQLDTDARELLESAALLHDVGYYVSYDKHHRHSYHLIMHAGIPGFTRREIAVVAATARYHTKALPKRKHESFSAIDPDDRPLVRQLAAILRIADGLDRGRGRSVDRVQVADDGRATRFTLYGSRAPHAELYGISKKKDLFEDVFARQVEVRVASAPSPDIVVGAGSTQQET
jgi:exopolyphosphatase/guanosine-5'-triphosphate,3'-diphosphate pyrophosphatase